jgi:hypothetical protein
LPTQALAKALKVAPRRSDPALDSFRAELEASWEQLDGAMTLPRFDGMLVLERAAARTIFMFAGGVHPVVVCKIPRNAPDTIEREASALVKAGSFGLAPRFLGVAAGSWVQEGIAGAPLEVQPIEPDDIVPLPWPEGLAQTSRALERLAAGTSASAGLDENVRRLLEGAASSELVSRATRHRVEKTIDDLEEMNTGVLKHSDTSPQNCLFHEGSFRSFIDWEMAEMNGMPAADVLNGAVSYLEHGIGLARWSEDAIVESFRSGWSSSPFFEAARAAARDAASAAGVGGVIGSLEVAFFARRLGRRLVSPDRFPTGPRTAARILDIVCAY